VPPLPTNSSYELLVPENSPAGFRVPLPPFPLAYDQNSPEAPPLFRTLTYSLYSNDRSIATMVDNTTGALALARGGPSGFDFETMANGRYSLILRVTDGLGLFADIFVTLVASDVSEPPAFAERNPTFHIAEQTGVMPYIYAAGQTVGSPVSAVDEDVFASRSTKPTAARVSQRPIAACFGSD
jgi:hypothetical protein